MTKSRQVFLAYAYVTAIAILGCAFFYWNVYQNRAAHIESRNLRIVQGIGNQILLQLENLSRPIWETANSSWDTIENNPNSLQHLQGVRQASLLPGKNLTTTTPTVLLNIDPPQFQAVLMAPGQSPVKLHIDNKNLFKWNLDKDFDHLLIFRKDPNSDGFQRLAGEARGSRQLLDVGKLGSAEDASWSPEQALAYSDVGLIELAGKSYKIYSHPFEAPLEAIFEEDAQGRRSYRSQRSETWVVAGLVDAALLHEQQMQVSPHYTVAILMALLMLIFSLPILRLRYLGPIGKISNMDVFQLKLSLLFSSFLLCMVFAYVYVFFVVHYQVGDNLKGFSDAMHNHLQVEVNDTLKYLDSDPFANKDLAAPKGVHKIFRANSKGQQIEKIALKGRNTPLVNILHREYFRQLQEDNAYINEDKPFFIEPIITITEGLFEVVIARPLYNGDGQFDGIIGAITRLESVMDPITPPLSTYVITDHEGRVLFSPASEKNLSENFFTETDAEEDLLSLARAQVRRHHSLTYQGRDFRCFSSPALEEVPWTIQTLSFKQPIREFYLAMTTQITIWFLGYTIVIFLLFALTRLYIFVRGSKITLWLAPSQISDATWLIIAIASFLAIALQKVMLFSSSLAQLGLIILIGIIIHTLAITLIIRDAQKKPSLTILGKDASWFARNRHILTFCIFSIASLILPMLAFSKGAYHSTASLYIKQGQLYILEDLRKHDTFNTDTLSLPGYLGTFFDARLTDENPPQKAWETSVHFALRDTAYLLNDQAKRRGFRWVQDEGHIYLTTGEKAIVCKIPPFFPFKNGKALVTGTLLSATIFFAFFMLGFFIVSRFVVSTIFGDHIKQPRILKPEMMLDLIHKGRSQRHLVLGSPSPYQIEFNGSLPENDSRRDGYVFPSEHPNLLVINMKVFLLNHNDWSPESLGQAFEEILSLNKYKTLIIDAFDYVPANMSPRDSAMEAVKFHCTERALARAGTSIFLFASSDPAVFYKASKLETQTPTSQEDDETLATNQSEENALQIDWQRLLKSFRKVGYVDHSCLHFKEEDTNCELQSYLREETRNFPNLIDIADEIDISDLNFEEVTREYRDAARGQFHEIWSHCSKEERLILHDLAEDGLINPTNDYLIRVLCARNLIIYQGRFKIFSHSFAQYVLEEFSQKDMPSAQLQQNNLSWRVMRSPIILLLVAGLAFVYFTQPGLWTTLGGFISTISIAILPAATKILRSLSTQRTDKAE